MHYGLHFFYFIFLKPKTQYETKKNPLEIKLDDVFHRCFNETTTDTLMEFVCTFFILFFFSSSYHLTNAESEINPNPFPFFAATYVERST